MSRRTGAPKAKAAAPTSKIQFRAYAPLGFGEELVVTGDTLVRFPAPERPRVFIRNDPPVPP